MASFHGYRTRAVGSLGGLITTRRAYYHCRSCGPGHYLWDRAVGLSERRLTPAVERLTTPAGAVTVSFEGPKMHAGWARAGAGAGATRRSRP
jgi:hypothetical protein